MTERGEKSPERFPTKQEVLEVIHRFDKNAKFYKAFSDASGLYLLEADVKGEKEGDYTLYRYSRKGPKSLVTSIQIAFYEKGEPVGGHTLSEFNEETGRWEDTK